MRKKNTKVHLVPKDKWWQRLPPEIQYLKIPSTIYTSGPMTDLIQEFVDSASSETIKEFARWYMVIADHGHSHLISQWIQHASLDDKKFGCYWPIFCMFEIFERFAKKGVHPFSTRHVRLTDHSEISLDWSRVPDYLQYLVPWVNRYGEIILDDLIEDSSKSVSDIEFESLINLGNVIKSRGDYQKINDWLNRDRNGCTAEGRLIYRFIGFLDSMNIEFE